jgi:hypothetical protein
MEERRTGRRDRTFLKGSIAFNNRNSTADCLIRNCSDQGAKIAFAEPFSLPAEIELSIPIKGQERRSRIVWRHGSEMGVRFAS